MTPTTELQRPIIKTELPGPKSREIIEADAQYVTPSYPRPDYKLVADHAQGVWITDPDGNVVEFAEYLRNPLKPNPASLQKVD